jgi:hypothetical protein
VADGKFRFYYWWIVTVLAENVEFLNPEAAGYHLFFRSFVVV